MCIFQRGKVKEQMSFGWRQVPSRWQEEAVKVSSQCQWTMSPTSVSCQRHLHPPIQQLGQPRTNSKGVFHVWPCFKIFYTYLNIIDFPDTQDTGKYFKWLLQTVTFRLHGFSSLCKWEAVSTWTGTVAPFVVQHSQTILAIAVVTLGHEFGANLTILDPTLPPPQIKKVLPLRFHESMSDVSYEVWSEFVVLPKNIGKISGPPCRFAGFWLLTWRKILKGPHVSLGGAWAQMAVAISGPLNVWMSERRNNNDSAYLNLYYLHIVLCIVMVWNHL